MKRLIIKELFRQIEYCFNALAIQYDMVTHSPRELPDLGSLINQYQNDFRKQAKDYKEWMKQHEKKNV